MAKSDDNSWVPNDRAASKQGVRVIRLVHFVSGHVVDCLDDGCDERGQPNQQRQHLINVLRKRLRFGGKELPTFRLKEAPGAWQGAISEKQRAIRARDPFDRDFLRDETGDWRLPSSAWLALAVKCREAEKVRNDDLRQQARSERAQHGLEVLERLARVVLDDKKATATP